MRLLQIKREDGGLSVVATDASASSAVRGFVVPGFESVYALALHAIEAGLTLAQAVAEAGRGEQVDLAALASAGQVAAPIHHPDPAHLLLTGTGLTHLGSAAGRDKMHSKSADDASQTDSMRMFMLGVEGGKPAPGETGAQPEWFYKGDGSSIRASGETLQSPSFALDGGEEPEIAAIYVIGPDGTPFRLGFALANEFSDHVTEKGNYLWLAHSKLRQASLGPELLTGPLPDDIRGTSRILRDGAVVWEKPFLTGEANMSHSLANLERHHFKYALFRRPGDVHVHFLGTATLSFADGFQTRAGDTFEIAAAPFALALSNTLAVDDDAAPAVREL